MIGNFGVLSTGVVIKQLTDVESQLEAGLQADLGAAFELLSQTPEGSLINRVSEQLADLWQFGEQVYNSLFPGTSSGTSLDEAESLVNVPRFPATASVYNGTLITGLYGTVIPDTFQVNVPGSPASIFQINQAMTIGPSGTLTATFVATETGPIQGPTGTLTILTTVPGLASVQAETAAQVGTYAETDAAYRTRAQNQISAYGTGTYSGLLKAVQSVQNVSQVYLLTNDTDNTVGGLLPHSVLLVVVGGADQDVANMIFAAKPAGINTNGSQTLTVTDSQGINHQVSFGRLINVPIYVDVVVSVNSNPSVGPVFPANGLALITEALINYGASAYQPNYSVAVGPLGGPINSVPGVPDYTCYIGLSYPAVAPTTINMANPWDLAQLLAGTDGSGNLYVTVTSA